MYNDYRYEDEVAREQRRQLLDESFEHLRKMRIELMDLQLEVDFKHLSQQELAKLRKQRIRKLDEELREERRKREIELYYERLERQMMGEPEYPY